MRKAKLAFLWACRALGLFLVARYWTRSRLKILCYHGFEFRDEASFRPKLFITAERFATRLETIRRYGFRVVSLDEAVDRLYSGALAENSLVITVDDGFHSFHKLALPILDRYAYPLTVYVTTYYVAKGAPIFRLVVQYMFWKTARTGALLSGKAWTSPVSMDKSKPAAVDKIMWDFIEYGERHCTEIERQRLCEELGQALGVPYDEIVRDRTLHLMTPEELRDLSNHNVSVELHTHRHSFPNDDQSAADREIIDNRAALREWIPGERRHFCYPSGLWDERQWNWLDELGVRSSTTCIAGHNSAKTPRHALRRFLDAESIDQLEFEAGLTGFSDLLREWLRRQPVPAQDA